MKLDAVEVEKLIKLVRRNFQRLRKLGDQIHGDLRINSSMRAIMEDLAANGPRSVPQIAADKEVSRQNIQHIVDCLFDSQLATPQDNPKHQRSPVIALTAKGRRLFAEIRAREAVILDAIAGNLPPDGVASGQRTLQGLLEAVRAQLERKDNDADIHPSS